MQLDLIDKKPPLLAEIGAVGIKRFGGYIREEWHHDLQGQSGIRIYREMSDNHPVIGAVFHLIEMLLRQVEYRVEASGDSPLHLQAKDLGEEALEDVDGGIKGLVSNALTLMPYGWSVCEKVYKIRRGNHESKLLRSRFRDGKIGFRKFSPRKQSSLDRWNMTDEGEVFGFWQRPAPRYDLRYLPAGKYLHFRVRPDADNPEGRSLLRNTYTSYYFQKNLQFVEAVGVERNIAGYPKMEVPPGILHPDATAAQKQIAAGYEDLVSKVKADEFAGIVVPSETDSEGNPTGYKFSLISSGGRSFAETDPIIKRYRSEIAMSLLAEFILLGMEKVGSFALSSNKTDFFALGVAGLLDSILETFNKDAMAELTEVNGLPPETAPRVEHGDIETPDLAEMGAFIGATSGSGALEVDRGINDFVRRIAGMPKSEPLPEMPAAPMQVLPEPVIEPAGPEKDLNTSPAMDVDEAAEYCNVSRSVIMGAIKRGVLPGAKIGGTFRILRDDLITHMRGGNGGNTL